MISSLSIKVLVENKVNREGLLGEHGLSLLIGSDGEEILFDTGYSQAFEYNARELGVDLCGIGTIVLSHGHFDHTGGLGKIAALGGKRTVYGHPDLFSERFSVKGENRLSIGIPFSRTVLEAEGLTFSLDTAPQEVSPGLMTSGEIPRIVPMVFPNLMSMGKKGMEPDPFRDDLFMLADIVWGYVLILGCTHSGLSNTLAHALNLTGGKPIRAVIGGLHLIKADDQRIGESISLLKDAGVEYCFPCHCTGFKATCRLGREYGERFAEASVGGEFVFSGRGVEIIPCEI